MAKVDFTISRDATINTGNYSSIKPSVTMTVKDIDSKDVTNKYKEVSQALDILMLMETIALGSEMESTQELGFKKYLAEIMKVDNEELTETLTTIMKGI
jgi:hypothetical protein